MIKTCKICKKPFDAKKDYFETCFNCSGKERGPAGDSISSSKLPDECIFETFYDGKTLKREIFIEAAKKAARQFEANKMTQTSIRRLFNMLKATQREAETAEPETAASLAKTRYFEFYRLTEYQSRRQSANLPEIFRQFAERHIDIAAGSYKEYCGFVEYLTSIIAYMKQK
jgi:CRISPR/Cas system CSM-associated protein Csm2 small subunit